MTRAAQLLEIDLAVRTLRKAQIGLSNAVQQAYPIGTEVMVLVGLVQRKVRITAYGTSPGDLIGETGATRKIGKTSSFYYTAIVGLVGDD